jgi:hypothetical protein
LLRKLGQFFLSTDLNREQVSTRTSLTRLALVSLPDSASSSLIVHQSALVSVPHARLITGLGPGRELLSRHFLDNLLYLPEDPSWLRHTWCPSLWNVSVLNRFPYLGMIT